MRSFPAYPERHELVQQGKESLETRFSLAIIPTVAPYIVPQFIEFFARDYPKSKISILEMRTDEIIRELKEATIDMAVLATPLQEPDLLEIPLYYEKFLAYVAPSDPNYTKAGLVATELPLRHLWVLQEGHCLRDQVFNFCSPDSHAEKQVYEAGSIDNLVRIIDSPPPVREISLVIYKDFYREKLLNAVADTIKQIIPADMLDNRLKKFAIKL